MIPTTPITCPLLCERRRVTKLYLSEHKSEIVTEGFWARDWGLDISGTEVVTEVFLTLPCSLVTSTTLRPAL